MATVIGAVLFIGLLIFGLGVLSYVTDRDILDVPGLGQYPGVAGAAVALLVFALLLRPIVRGVRPSFGAVWLTALAATLVHLVAVWGGALLSGVGIAAATSAVSQLVVGGSSLVILLAGLLAGWTAVALRRTRNGPPRWPWEGDR
ncbi:MAG: hypothetical protein WA971_02770 [Microbacterium sp.]